MVSRSCLSRLRRSVTTTTRIEEWPVGARRKKLDELVGGPGDGVRLARTSGMLNQIGVAGARAAWAAQAAHHIQLVEKAAVPLPAGLSFCP